MKKLAPILVYFLYIDKCWMGTLIKKGGVYLKKLLIIPFFLLAGCGMFNEETQTEEVVVETNAEVILVGNALMHNSEGEVIGEILLKQTEQGVQFTTLLNNLPPGGTHGIHVHEVGVCEAPSFESAGAHFNPEHKQHGIENENGPHAGDLPNIEIDEDGSAQLTFYSKAVTLKLNEPNSLFDEDGSSIVIHEKPDDYKTDPAGNSGARIACGVIK